MLIATFSHHHSSERPNWKAKVSSHVEALALALEDEFGVEIDPNAGGLEDLLDTAKEKGEAAFDPEEGTFVVWWHDGGANFGVGEGETADGSDRHTNVWIALAEWEPDPERVAELEALSKDELVRTILEREALSP